MSEQSTTVHTPHGMLTVTRRLPDTGDAADIVLAAVQVSATLNGTEISLARAKSIVDAETARRKR